MRGVPLDRPDQADEGHGPKDPAELPIAGREIDDLHRRALESVISVDQDRGVAHIALPHADHVIDVDVPEDPVASSSSPGRQQGAEEGVAVDSRRTGPDESTGTRSIKALACAVADGKEVESLRHMAEIPFD
jgi:hypothetical protein